MDLDALLKQLDEEGKGAHLGAWWRELAAATGDENSVLRDNVRRCSTIESAIDAVRAADAALGGCRTLHSASKVAAYAEARMRGRLVEPRYFASGIAHALFIPPGTGDLHGLDDSAILPSDIEQLVLRRPVIWLTSREAVVPADIREPGDFALDVCQRLGLDYPQPGWRLAVLQGDAPPAGWGARVPSFWDSAGYPCWGPSPEGSVGRTRHLVTGDASELEVVVVPQRGLLRPVRVKSSFIADILNAPPDSRQGLACRARTVAL